MDLGKAMITKEILENGIRSFANQAEFVIAAATMTLKEGTYYYVKDIKTMYYATSSSTYKETTYEDVNGNVSYNNNVGDYATTATAAGITVLTVSSKKRQFFTGILSQTVQMPVTSTLSIGQTYEIYNESTKGITIKSSGGNTITVLMTLNNVKLTCISLSGTGIASWQVETTELKQNTFVGIDEQTPLPASAFSINTTDLTLTITPPLGYFNFFVDGNGTIRKYTKVGNQVFPVFTDTTGLWFFYYDITGTAVTTTVPWDDFSVIVPIYRMTWNATKAGDAKIITQFWEAHENTISADDHAWKHANGSIWLRGLANSSTPILTGTPDASGINTCISLSSGNLTDDNLEYGVTNSLLLTEWNQDLGELTPANITVANGGLFNIRYKGAASVPELVAATRFPFLWNSGTNRLEYINTAGARTTVTDQYYTVWYIFAIQDNRNGNTIRITPAYAQYSTLIAAQAVTWATVQSQDAVALDTEIRPLYRLIFQTRYSGGSAYPAAVKYTALREVQDVRKVVVTQTTNTGGSVPATGVTTVARNNLTGTNAQSQLYELSDDLQGYETTVSAATTTTMTNISMRQQYLTGTTTHIHTLPVTSTVYFGRTFEFINKSTGLWTINSSGGNVVVIVPSGAICKVVCIGITLTTAADWNTENAISAKSFQDVSLGSELIINAVDKDFSGANNWTGTDWTVGSNVYTHTASANAATLAGYAAVSGQYYQVTITIVTTTVGTLTMSYGGTNAPVIGQVLGTLTSYIFVVTAANTNGLVLTPNATWAGNVDNVSIKLITVGTPTSTHKNASGTICSERYNRLQLANAIGTNSQKYATSTNILTFGSDTGSYCSGLYNTFIGNESGQYATNAAYNTLLGYRAGRLITCGSSNTVVGANAALATTIGIRNTVIGNSASESNIYGNRTTAVGMNALLNSVASSDVVAIGQNAGRYYTGNVANIICDTSVYIGSETKAKADGGLNEIVIGYNVIGNGSNTATMGNSSVTATYLPGQVISTGTYAATSASAANMFIDTDGKMYRSTSSLIYKREVEPLSDDFANEILDINTVFYRSKCDSDNKDWSFIGIIAEEMESINPRYVHFGYAEDAYETIITPEHVITEEKNEQDENGDVIVTYEDITIPESQEKKLKEDAAKVALGVQYERLVVPLIKKVQMQEEVINSLIKRLEALETKIL